MGTEKMNLVPTTTPTHQQGGPSLNNPHLLFHLDDTTTSALHRFAPLHRHSGDPGPKTTRELTTGFIDDPHRFFQPPPDFRRPLYASHPWNVNGRPTAHGSDGDEDEDDDDDDDEEELDDGDGELKIINHNSSNTSSSRDLLMKEGNLVPSGDDGKNNNNDNNVRAVRSCENQASQFENATAITIADPDGNLYYPHQSLHGTEEGSAAAAGHKDVSLVENGCGFSGRKDVSYSSAGESLRGILSDPLTGSLMDDAMILPCGHSFGGGGMQHVIRMKACHTCSQTVSEDLVAANLSLRAAVQAFRREEELQVYPASKRRREKFEQDKSGHGDLAFTDPPRGRGVQFPFIVTDRVIIKGNKRTPPRFVGREAVVTTQCLNGWYVVKTLDNAESVKLQYRSLAKVADDCIPKPISSKMTPNWL